MLALLWFPSLYSLYWYCINRLSTGTEIWTNQLKSWIYCYVLMVRSIRCCVEFLHHLHLLFSYCVSCSTFHGTSLCRLGKSSRTWNGKTEGEDDTRTTFPHFFHFISFSFSFSFMLALFCFLLFCFRILFIFPSSSYVSFRCYPSLTPSVWVGAVVLSIRPVVIEEVAQWRLKQSSSSKTAAGSRVIEIGIIV